MKCFSQRQISMLIIIAIVFFIVFTAGCAHKPIGIKLNGSSENAPARVSANGAVNISDAVISEHEMAKNTLVSLELCLDFDAAINSDDKLLHINAINHFIEQYNNASPDYILVPCVKGESRAIKLIIQNTRYVPPSEQALYIVVSSIGVYSLLNGGFGLVWAGFNTTTLGVELSDDIAVQKKVVYRQFYSSPFFLELTSIKRKHMKQFEIFMFQLLKEIHANEQRNEPFS